MSSTPRSIRRSRASPRHRLPDVRPGPGGGADRRRPACPGLSRPVVVVVGVGRPGPPAVRGPRCAHRGAGCHPCVGRTDGVRAGHAVLAVAECGSAARGLRDWDRSAVASVGMVGAPTAEWDSHGARGAITAVVVLPCAWVIAEAVRSWDRLGGPWALLGASQWNQPATLAPASIGGVWLVSFLVVAVNTAVVAAILLRSDASGRTAPHPRGPRPCMVLVESGAAARADGADRARPAR